MKRTMQIILNITSKPFFKVILPAIHLLKCYITSNIFFIENLLAIYFSKKITSNILLKTLYNRQKFFLKFYITSNTYF